MDGGSDYLFSVRIISSFCDFSHRNFVVVSPFRDSLAAKINNPTPLLTSPFFPDFHEVIRNILM